MNAGKVVEETLSEKQLGFIKAEFGHDLDALRGMDDDDIDYIYEKLCDIEVDETIAAGDGELSDRGKMAVSIVTAIGEKLYRPNDEPDDFTE